MTISFAYSPKSALSKTCLTCALPQQPGNMRVALNIMCTVVCSCMKLCIYTISCSYTQGCCIVKYIYIYIYTHFTIQQPCSLYILQLLCYHKLQQSTDPSTQMESNSFLATDESNVGNISCPVIHCKTKLWLSKFLVATIV